jgi:hypothetical protein
MRPEMGLSVAHNSKPSNSQKAQIGHQWPSAWMTNAPISVMEIQFRSVTTATPKNGLSVRRFVAIGALTIGWLLLMPFAPGMPSAGVDGSWPYALNEAVARGLVFGRDVIFTFGPLASAYTRLYSPATDTMMMVGSAIYAAGICGMLGLAAYPRRDLMALLVPIIVVLCPLVDSILFVLPFSLLLNVVRVGLRSESRFHLKPSIPVILALALATIAVGIEPIIKASFAGVALSLGFLTFAVLLFTNWRIASAFSALVGLSLISGWVLSGQPLQVLPLFFAAEAPIISGYTEAMSISAGLLAPLTYLAASFVLLLSTYYHFNKEPAVSRWVVVAGLAWTIFVGFKGGFVRQDAHVLISAGVLLLLCYLVCTLLTRKVALAVAVVGIGAWCIIVRTVQPFPSEKIPQVAQILDGIITRIIHPGALKQKYTAAIEHIKAQNPLPHVEGTVDVYPTDVAAIFANNLQWSGRPVFQSYSAYTPELQAKNVAHLTGATAPDTVFFTFSPIDERLPASDDSESLLKLISTYRITDFVSPYVRMDRAPESKNAQLRDGEARLLMARWNQDIALPDTAPLWITIDARPSLLGRLVESAFKLPQLEIDLTLADGSVAHHRFIASVARSGFIVSPYLTSPIDLINLAAGLPSARAIKSLKLVTHSPTFWNSNIDVRVTPISITPQPTARALANAQRLMEPSPQSRPIKEATATCKVDFVNGERYQPNLMREDHGGSLRLQGWIAPPPNVDSNSMSTWAALTSDDGNREYFKALPEDRSDVIAALQRPAFGFDITLDLNAHLGRQIINLYSVSESAAYQCSETMNVE